MAQIGAVIWNQAAYDFPARWRLPNSLSENHCIRIVDILGKTRKRQHKAHMAYDKLKALGLPIGSGAIESAIRRVLNLRIKGPAIYCKKESADAIILLRSYFKAGRWNTLKTIALAPTIKVVA